MTVLITRTRSLYGQQQIHQAICANSKDAYIKLYEMALSWTCMDTCKRIPTSLKGFINFLNENCEETYSSRPTKRYYSGSYSLHWQEKA
jgi:hypothetical protein